MRLKKAQKELILSLVAEGLDTGEINKRAAEFIDPFEVSRAQLLYYRRTRKVDINEIRQNGEHKALNTGLAKSAVRVEKLKELAERLFSDLMDEDLVWTEQVKGVGSGVMATIVDYLEFNKAEIDSYRGLLDDIAKEVGDRTQKHDIKGNLGLDMVVINWDDHNTD